MDNDKLAELLAAATPGPWWVCEYDAGDVDYYDHNGPCPSVQAPEDQDCAVIHWDGFKQEYWSSANGNQKQITANAALIAMAPDLAAEVLRLRAQVAALTARVDEAGRVITLLQDDVGSYDPDWAGRDAARAWMEAGK
jgi:hypothetical protein